MGWISRAAGAAAALALQGCASIVGGSMQPVSVQSLHNGEAVHGASCALTNDKGTWFISTPGSATVQRSFSDMQVRCTKQLLPTGDVQARSLVRPLSLGNVLFGGIIGVGVDHVTGASYYYPDLITVVMGQSIAVVAEPAFSAPIPPRVISASSQPTETPQASSAAPVTPVIETAPPTPQAQPQPQAQQRPPAAPAAAPRVVGQESHQVARMPEVKACNANADPVLVNKSGSALESYTVACSAGGSITVHCEWGACRLAK